MIVLIDSGPMFTEVQFMQRDASIVTLIYSRRDDVMLHDCAAREKATITPERGSMRPSIITTDRHGFTSRRRDGANSRLKP